MERAIHPVEVRFERRQVNPAAGRQHRQRQKRRQILIRREVEFFEQFAEFVKLLLGGDLDGHVKFLRPGGFAYELHPPGCRKPEYLLRHLELQRGCQFPRRQQRGPAAKQSRSRQRRSQQHDLFTAAFQPAEQFLDPFGRGAGSGRQLNGAQHRQLASAAQLNSVQGRIRSDRDDQIFNCSKKAHGVGLR